MKNVAIPSRLLVVGLVALVGCGSSVQPIDVDTGCPEMPLRGPEEFAGAPPERVIDDFEDGNDLMLAPIAGRNGSWISIATLGATTVGTRHRVASRAARALAISPRRPRSLTPRTGMPAWWHLGARRNPGTPALTAGSRSGSRWARARRGPTKRPSV